MTRTPRRTLNQPARQTLNTKSTGEILHAARKACNQTIEQISAAINIRPSILKSIEEGKFFGLTDPLYLKGFIRTYAQYVGLKDDDVLPFFRREYDEQAHQQQLTQPLSPINTKKAKITPGWVVVGFLIVAIIGVVAYAYQQYVSVALTPQLSLQTPANQTQTAADQITVTGQTDPDATLSLNGQTIPIDPTGQFTTSVGLASGSNILTFQAKNKLGKTATTTRTVISNQPVVSSTPVPSPTVVAVAPTIFPTISQLSIKVTIGPNSAWLSLTIDGQPGFSGILLPGATKTFIGQAHIHLKTGNAGSTRVNFKDQDQGLLGATNQVVDKDYTP